MTSSRFSRYSAAASLAAAGLIAAAPVASAFSLSDLSSTNQLSSAPAVASQSADSNRLSQYVDAVNQRRADADKQAVTQSADLDKEAQAWADHLASTGEFVHDDMKCTQIDGRDMCLSENIAINSQDAAPSDFVTQWFNSTGHRENMLRDNAVLVGHGEARYTAGQYAGQVVSVERYWNAY